MCQCARVGKVLTVGPVGGGLKFPDYFWSTGGRIRGGTGKLLGEVMGLLDG